MKLIDKFHSMFAPETGADLRDAGIAQVLDNQDDDWIESAREWTRHFIATLPEGQYFTGEDVRLYAQDRAGKPKHHNAWGGVIGGAIREAVKDCRIELAGVTRAGQRSAHARLYPRYVVVPSVRTAA